MNRKLIIIAATVGALSLSSCSFAERQLVDQVSNLVTPASEPCNPGEHDEGGSCVIGCLAGEHEVDESCVSVGVDTPPVAPAPGPETACAPGEREVLAPKPHCEA